MRPFFSYICVNPNSGRKGKSIKQVKQRDFTIVECPRDAMQGISHFIPTEKKIEYLKALLKCNFEVLDCGSFVNPESVPQMADTNEVINAISEIDTPTKLLVIVANERGALKAVIHPKIKYLGYPFSLSETFQRRNTNSTQQDSFIRLAKIQEIAVSSGKEVVAYISMAFGNPYGDEYHAELAMQWADKIGSIGVRIISLADTTGLANVNDIQKIYSNLIPHFPHIDFGAHFHAKAFDWENKIQAALDAGCKRFDGALLGFGGCPFAKDDLTGNIPMEQLIPYLNENGYIQKKYGINSELLGLASTVFAKGEI